MRSNLISPLALPLLLIALLALPAAASADPNGSPSPFRATQGVEFSGKVASFSEIDDHNFDSGPAATINWGDGTSSSGTATGDRAGQKYDVTGSHTYAKFGTFQVTVTLLWHDANMPQQTIAAGPNTVGSGLSPIPTDIRTPGGQPFSGAVGSFRDDRTDATNDRTKYAATVDWGDGSATTPGEVDSTGGTTFRVVSGHNWTQAGTFKVRTTITGTNGATTTIPSTAVVTGDPKPAISVEPLRPCANIPTTFGSATSATPGAPIVSHVWKIEDPSAFGPINGGKPFDTGSTPSLTYTFGYSSVQLGLGSDDAPPPELPLRLFRKPVTVSLTVKDATGEVRSTSRTVSFLDDGYRPTEAAPTPKGCGKSLFSDFAVLKTTSPFKVAKTGSFKFSAGCPRITDCLAQVTLLPLPGGPRVAAAGAKKAKALGGGVAYLRPGTSGAVPVRLTRGARALLKANGSLRAQLVVTSLAGGRSKTTKRTITLKP